MKNKIFPNAFVAGVGILALMLSAMSVVAENPPSSAAPPLTAGVPDVLKLSQANVSENTILSYIETSSASYAGLSASEIVYLHAQGVSDHVVTAMLNQHQKLAEANAQWVAEVNAQAAQQTTAAPSATAQAAPSTATTVQYPAQNVAPAVTYVETPPPSSVYIMQDSSPSIVDYGYYPSYGYSGYCYPPAAFSFGFGGERGFHDGCGFHGGGGFHDGGGSHGGGGGHHR